MLDPLKLAGSSASSPAEPMLQACLFLMRDLHSSLESSQSALLGRDLLATERLMSEQTLLLHQLREALEGLGGTSAGRSKGLGLPERAETLRAPAERVQNLARLQMALLRRARQQLRVLDNWMSEPGAAYGPPSAGVRWDWAETNPLIGPAGRTGILPIKESETCHP